MLPVVILHNLCYSSIKALTNQTNILIRVIFLKNSQTDIRKLSHYQLFSAINDDVDFEQHMHDHYEIVIAIENNFYHTINGKTHQPDKGEIVILRPGDIHGAQPIKNKPHKIRDIYVPKRYFEDICRNLSSNLLKDIILTDPINPPSFTLSENAIHSINNRLSTPLFTGELPPVADFTYPEVIKKAIISELLGIYCSKQLKREKYIPDCITKLLNACQNPDFAELQISEMAYELGYSHNYLCAQFKDCFGKTIQQFLIERKIEKAAVLLRETRMSVESISKSLGWNKTSSFIRNFSSAYGQTPLQYRKNHRIGK